MSEEDDETSESEESQEDSADVDAETIETQLQEAEQALEEAETEEDLDDVEETLNSIEDTLESAELPEPDEEEEESVAEEFENQLTELQSELENQRGPYAETVISSLEDISDTLADTRWTDDGTATLQDSVGTFLNEINDILETEYETTAEEPVDELASQITTVAEEIESRDLDPDQDTATIQSLKEQTEELDSAVEGAEAWDDLTVREKLQAEGFFDAINTKHKDFPPEWSALKEWEAENNTEMILLALDLMDSDFMERHCLEALKRMGDPAAIDPILERAGRRDKEAVRILGKMADEQALDTIQEYITEDSDTGLLRVTLKAVGEIGSDAVTEDVVNALGFDNESVRSHAARSLGMIGDTRAINPLSTVLANDESDTVRASAAWALVQIGTQEALQEVASYTDDDAFIVQSEAEKAENALTEAPKA